MTLEPDPSFYTPEMNHAERELDARIDQALRVARETEAKLEALEAQDEEKRLTDEDVDRLKAFVTGYARTPEWQRVIDKITDGALTWRKVAEDVVGRTDPDVAEAFRSLQHVPPARVETLIETGVLPPQPAQPGVRDEEPEAAPEPETDHSDYFARAQEEAEWHDDDPPPWR